MRKKNKMLVDYQLIVLPLYFQMSLSKARQKTPDHLEKDKTFFSMGVSTRSFIQETGCVYIWFDYSILSSLPNDKILDWSKLRASADDKSNINSKRSSCLSCKIENILGKGENADFSFSHFVFKSLV